jgi:rhodanese-related sulfurtransferase
MSTLATIPTTTGRARDFLRDATTVLVMFVAAGIAGALVVRHRHAIAPKHPSISLTELRAYVDSGEALLLDARDKTAYGEGHIPQAHSLPIQQWRTRETEWRALLASHRNRLVIVYCGNPWCGQAEELQLALVNLGLKRVGLFDGGYDAWRAAGYPVDVSP